MRPYPHLPVLGLVAVCCLGCGEPAPSGGELEVQVGEVGESAPLPYTEAAAIAALPDGRVCLIDSYEHRILCGDRDWSEAVATGQEGEGPGEFSRPLGLADAGGGLLAVVDIRLDRLTLLDGGMRVRGSRRVPGRFIMAGVRGDSVVGVVQRLLPAPSARDRAAALLDSVRVQVVAFPLAGDAATDTGADTTDVVIPAPNDERRGPLIVTAATLDPAGGLLLNISGRAIARIGVGFEGMLPLPELPEETPSAASVERWERGYRRGFGGLPPRDAVQRFRDTPKSPLTPFAPRLDESGRIWIATNRDRETRSYFAVLDSTGASALVPIRDRIVAFDINGDELIALVESEGADGVPVQRLRFYRLARTKS